ncbi:S26 family signal peptidase [Glycomyces tritici]|uniref:S26 family signal peptidase n=1 Tax=Glycomyces tritici TaxID=2665176 RepID=A0ABT7YMC0_9ACTN|nr:S26 family signal peptidase [Glycomyces tritici]MDN3239774.1 S26 family signal peptidase [Glycomyces tritici]
MTSSNWFFALGLIVAALLTAESVRQLRRRWVLVEIKGVSMEPALHDGDEVLAKRTRNIAVGDIVVVTAPDPRLGWAEAKRAPSVKFASRGSAPSPWWVKRVTAGPGEPMPDSGEPVPPGHYFLLSDNPEVRDDSRRHGPCPANLIVGSVIRSF